MTDNIQTFVNYCISEKYFSHAHSIDILQMYHELKTYEYNDIFTDGLHTINTAKLQQSGGIKNIFNIYERINNIFFKSTIINNDKNYKMLVISNNNYNKEILIINFLREIYFHKKFRDTFIAHNIEHVIVPEIYRYGIINLANDEFAIFYETFYYIDENQISIDARTDPITFINSIKTFFSCIREAVITTNSIETELNIKHHDIVKYNNIPSDKYFEQVIQIIDMNVEDGHEHPYDVFVKDMENNFGCSNGKINTYSNMIKYNNKIILIDFENAGTKDVPNIGPNLLRMIDNKVI